MSDDKKTESKPDCYKCVHKMNVPGSAHSRCNNFQAKVSANGHGVKNGWFDWPINFDPVWLESCDGFSSDSKDKKPEQRLNPLAEMMGILR